jgi:hypothetical protein
MVILLPVPSVDPRIRNSVTRHESLHRIQVKSDCPNWCKCFLNERTSPGTSFSFRPYWLDLTAH